MFVGTDTGISEAIFVNSDMVVVDFSSGDTGVASGAIFGNCMSMISDTQSDDGTLFREFVAVVHCGFSISIFSMNYNHLALGCTNVM